MRLLCFLLLASVAHADNTVSIDQIGTGNTVSISQDGSGHTATVNLGHYSAVDYASLSIVQQGTGAKSSQVEIKSGINNGVTVFQDGTGNHSAAIQNLNGSANNINLSQTGTGSHSLVIAADNGTINNNNTINATQSGSANKSFNLTLSGTSGAGITVEQTNQTMTDSGSMSIQCLVGCGNYSYIRH